MIGVSLFSVDSYVESFDEDYVGEDRDIAVKGLGVIQDNGKNTVWSIWKKYEEERKCKKDTGRTF